MRELHRIFHSIAMQQVTLLHREFSVDLENLDLTCYPVDADDPDGSGIVINYREYDVIGTDDLDIDLMSFRQALDFCGRHLVGMGQDVLCFSRIRIGEEDFCLLAVRPGRAELE